MDFDFDVPDKGFYRQEEYMRKDDIRKQKEREIADRRSKEEREDRQQRINDFWGTDNDDD